MATLLKNSNQWQIIKQFCPGWKSMNLHQEIHPRKRWYDPPPQHCDSLQDCVTSRITVKSEPNSVEL